MNRRECGYLAMLMAANCLRDTDPESHAIPGKTNDPETMAFNKAVMNKLFTFLTFYFGETDEAPKMAFLKLASRYYPDDWGLPELDESMVAEVNEALKKGSESKLAGDALGNQTSF